MTTFNDFPSPSDSTLKRSSALSEIIRHEIDQHAGLISFAQFMALALYHPKLGYYNADSFNIGKLGDFTTASEMSPLYAICFAKQALGIFDSLDQSHFLEIGAGTGRFALNILQYLDRCKRLPDHYFIYEASPALRTKQQAFLKANCPHLMPRIQWLIELPSHFKGVIIANEVLDALPVHCFSLENGLVKEKCVSFENDQFVWKTTEATSPTLTHLVTQLRDHHHLSNGYESEVNLSARSLIEGLANALSQGVILFADYGYGEREYYHPQRNRGTLTCFYQHQRHDNPLIFPGLQDITAHVNFTHVIEVASAYGCGLAGYTSQAAFLLALGLIDIAAEEEKHLSPTVAFELHQAIKLLTLPTEMGERVKIMGLTKGFDSPLLGFSLHDRRRDL